MKWLDCEKNRSIVVVFLAAMLLGALDANAEIAVSEPVLLGPPVYSDFMDGDVCLSADGLTLYLASDRPANPDWPYFGDWGIFVAERDTLDSGWCRPVHIGLNINTWHQAERNPCISYDGRELYFDRGSELYVSTRDATDDEWDLASSLGAAVNSTALNKEPCISPDGLSLYFASDRDGGEGGMDLYVATRPSKDAAWSTPMNLGPTVNSPGNEAEPSMTSDSLSLIFESDRLGCCDLWATTRMTVSEPWREPLRLDVGDVVETSGAYISPDGKTLYFNNRIDVGIQCICSTQIAPVVDLCCNGKVDLEDLLLVLEGWGPCASCCDIGPMPWGDGVVDNADVDVLVSYWGQTMNMVGYWKLDETEGQIACDSSECRHDALVEGNPIWYPNDGKVDGALTFDGIDDCIEVPLILDPAAGPFSVFAWVLGGAPGQVILCQDNGAKWLLVGENGVLATELSSPGTDEVLISPACITDGLWHRVGLTWDGSTRTLYMDDVEVAADTQLYLASQDTILYIGAAGPGNRGRAATFFCGLIDDVRIYNRAVKP